MNRDETQGPGPAASGPEPGAGAFEVDRPRTYEPLDFAERRGSRGPGVWLLFTPVLFLLGFAVWQRSQATNRVVSLGTPNAPVPASPEAFVPGWSGRVELASAGVALALRLEPLHRLPSRQGFDAAALAARFRGIEAAEDSRAEPWRLTIQASSRNGGGGDGTRVAVAELSAVRVGGLAPLVPFGMEPLPSGVYDPLAALFRIPDAPLREGQTCDLIFFGARPGGDVLVTGLGLDTPVTLRPTSRSSSRASDSIARLDARKDARSEDRSNDGERAR